MLFKRKDIFDEILGDTAPVIILGRSGSGKSNTLLYLCLRALEAKYSIVILDYSGEFAKYKVFSVVEPRLPFRRDILLSLIEPTIYSEGRAVSLGAVDVSGVSGWDELFDLLKAEAIRNRGAEVILRRLLPLKTFNVLVDKGEFQFQKPTDVDFSQLPEYSKVLAMSLYVTYLCELAKEGRFQSKILLCVEEAWSLPLRWELLSNTMRKYGIKLVLVFQTELKNLSAHIVVHDLGASGRTLRFKLGLPSAELRVGECWVYCLRRQRWCKVSVPKVHDDKPRIREVREVEKNAAGVEDAKKTSDVKKVCGSATSKAETTNTSGGASGGKKFVSISKVVYSQDPVVQRLIEKLETEVTVLKSVVGDLKDSSESDRVFMEELARRLEEVERKLERVERLEREIRVLKYQLARLMDAVQRLVEAYEVEVMRHA